MKIAYNITSSESNYRLSQSALDGSASKEGDFIDANLRHVFIKNAN